MAAVAARRSTWTVWNVRAEVERLLRAEVPFLPPERHRELADAVTALAVSPRVPLSVRGAVAARRACRTAARRRGVGVHRARRRPVHQSSASLTPRRGWSTRPGRRPRRGCPGRRRPPSLDGFEAVARTSLDAGQRGLVTAFACDSRLLLAGIGPGRVGEDDRDARPGVRAPRGRAAARPARHVRRLGGRARPRARGAGGEPAQVHARMDPRAVRRQAPRRGRRCRSGRACSASSPATSCSSTRPGWRAPSCSTSSSSSPPRAARSCGCSAMTGSSRRSRAAARCGWSPPRRARRVLTDAVPVPRPRRGRGDAPAADRGRVRGRLVPPARAHPVRVPRGDGPGRLHRLEERHARREGHPDGRRRRRRRDRAVRPGPRRPRHRRAGRGGRGRGCGTATSPGPATGSSPGSTTGGCRLFGGRDWVKNGDAWHVERRHRRRGADRPAPRPTAGASRCPPTTSATRSSCCTRPPRTAPRAPPSTPPTR